jgi:hypothetical protein
MHSSERTAVARYLSTTCSVLPDSTQSTSPTGVSACAAIPEELVERKISHCLANLNVLHCVAAMLSDMQASDPSLQLTHAPVLLHGEYEGAPVPEVPSSMGPMRALCITKGTDRDNGMSL